jgi:ribosomal protein S18 acetylase RimI-like enzyme
MTEELGAANWPDALRDGILDVQYRARRQSLATNYAAAVPEILLSDGEPAGWAVIEHAPGGFRLVEIAVAAAARGRGIATARIRELLAEAGPTQPVRLSVLPGNPAIRLYERLGFRRTAQDEVRISMERPGV